MPKMKNILQRRQFESIKEFKAVMNAVDSLRNKKVPFHMIGQRESIDANGGPTDGQDTKRRELLEELEELIEEEHRT